MKLSLAHLFKSAIAFCILSKTSSKVFPMQKAVVSSANISTEAFVVAPGRSFE